ncbi:MAG TPA: ferrous iron transporter B, partial [Kofleriaceae bacterium]
MTAAAACHDAGAASAPAVVPGRPQLVLAGNPNVGKTTLFNALTGSSAKVSNYPGITVESVRGSLTLPGGTIADLRDLPGTYSTNARSAEEQIALDELIGLPGPDGAHRAPDAAIVCLDANQVARSAYLLLQCQELGVRCVVAMTMIDEAREATPDPRKLGDVLGCEVVAVTARTRAGLDELLAAVGRALRGEREATWRWQPSAGLRARLDAVRAAFPADWQTGERYRSALPPADDAVALWALTCVEPRMGTADDDELDIPGEVRKAVIAEPPPRDDEAVLGRWRWLDRVIPPLIARAPDHSRTEKIDRVLLHRAGGFAVFLAVMTVLFMSLFWWASPVMDGIDATFKWLGEQLHQTLGDGVFTDFLTQGVIGGVGTVLTFLPQILLLFLFLGFLEDCGYLARVAYLMDRIMRSMNLHGRAFVPMLSGFACAVPAILATRTMERRRDRILTMMVVPLMTCSARLPVYTLVIGALIPGPHWVQGLIMVGMYLFSVLTALIAAWVMSKTIKPLKAKRLPFVIELPPYRFPR